MMRIPKYISLLLFQIEPLHINIFFKFVKHLVVKLFVKYVHSPFPSSYYSAVLAHFPTIKRTV